MRSLFAVLVAALAAPAAASNLDITASYRMKAASYRNLGLNPDNSNNHSFLYNDARFGAAVRKISLEAAGGGDATLDVGLLFHAVGVAGSSASLTSPFDRLANHYPNTHFTPFFENAYLQVNQLFGYPWQATVGQQSFKLGSGLLLDDDGAGLAGLNLKAELPWWGLKTSVFYFNDKNPLFVAPNSLDLYGLSIDLPTEGLWQFNQLFERDKALQPVFGCSFLPASGVRQGCVASKASRSFSSLRYQINYGPMIFDGEVALQRGAATPTGLLPAPNHITYQGDAQVARAKWKQRLYKTGEGIARLSVARASGDDPATETTDEAFFPSKGHRFSGLERSGFGDFFAASPYDAYGGNYSTSSASGLRDGASGIIVVGGGYSTPAYKNFNLDIDYFLYHADRIRTGARTLGMEWDFKLNYALRDLLKFSVSAALFKAGTASNPTRGTSRKYAFEASGRF